MSKILICLICGCVKIVKNCFYNLTLVWFALVLSVISYVPVPTPLPISKWLVDPTRTVFYSCVRMRRLAPHFAGCFAYRPQDFFKSYSFYNFFKSWSIYTVGKLRIFLRLTSMACTFILIERSTWNWLEIFLTVPRPYSIRFQKDIWENGFRPPSLAVRLYKILRPFDFRTVFLRF